MSSAAFPYRQWLAVTLCLLVPVLCFLQWRPGFELPGARSGDEPHYLVMAYSLVHDGDLFVDDDYATPRFRDPRDRARFAANPDAALPYQQGLYLSGFPLSHHSNLVVDSGEFEAPAALPPLRFARWDEVYDFRESGDTNARTLLDRFEIVRRPAYAELETRLPGPLREIAWHPPGYPILLAAAAWPAIHSGAAWTELWIVALQIALLAAALVCAQRLAPGARHTRQLSSAPMIAAVGLCTAAGYYAATLYTEALTPALCLFALYALDRQRLLACSLMLGQNYFIKERHAPHAVIFAAAAGCQAQQRAKGGLRNGVTAGLQIAVFPALAFALFILRNLLLYDTPFQTYYPWMTNPDILAGVLGLLGDAKTGVLVFSPVALVALYGLRRLARRRRTLVAVIAASCAYFFALSAATIHWSGGPSYAYRLLVPAVAMLLPGIFASWRARPALRRKAPRWARPGLMLAALLFWVSLVNGFFAATNLAYAYDADAYINLVEPERSGLVRRLLD